MGPPNNASSGGSNAPPSCRGISGIPRLYPVGWLTTFKDPQQTWGGTGTPAICFFRGATLPKTKCEFTPENGWLEDDPFLFGAKDPFSGPKLLLVLGRVSRDDDS